MRYDYDAYQKILRERLSEERYQHSVNVAAAAEELAQLHGADPGKARLAGLLHDICKDDPKEQQLQRMRASGIIWDEKAMVQPALWHSMAGFLFIRDELGLLDADLLNAVRYHTSGRAGMSLLEKIVYLADATSAERVYEDVDALRVLTRASLDKAMLSTLQYNISALLARKAPVVNDTIEAYNEYVME